MAETDFKVQKGIIVSDGNIVVSNASGSSGTDAVVYAKEFNTHASSTLTSSGLDIRGNTIAATADGGTANLDINITPKGTGEVIISTSLNLSEGNITNAGDINADSISVDAAGTGLNIDFSGANTTKSKITLGDNLADALNINEGGNSYMKFITTNSSEQIVFGQNVDINGGSIDGTIIGAAAQATASVTSLLATSHARVNGTARETNTLLQINGDYIASGGNLGGGGSAASANTNKYAEVRLYSDIANDDLAGMHVEHMGGVFIVDNAEEAPNTGQGTIYTVGRSDATNADSWGVGRQATTGNFAIGYIAKDYDNVADSSENPMRTGQARLEIDTSGNTTLNRVGAYFAFTGATSGAAEREIRFLASSNAISSNNTGAQTYTLPTDFPSSSSKVLQSTTTGTLSWVAQSGGIALSALSVGSEGTPSGDGSLAYNNSTGVFTYTPPVNVTGNAATVTVADESSDTTCFPLFATAASGSLAPKTGTNLTFNSVSGLLTQTGASSDAIGLVLKNTASDNGSAVNGQVLRFTTNRALGSNEGGQNNDIFGYIQWYGNDSAGNNQNFGMIKVKAEDVTSNSEKGSMQFAVATSGSNGSVENVLTITGGAAAASSTVTIAGNLQVDGTTTTVNSTTIELDDKNIELAKGLGNDAAVDGGGITLVSSQGNKTFNWVDSSDAWTSSENLELASGKKLIINSNDVLTQTTLGSTVLNSSLTSVGTIATGVWNGTAITDTYVANDLTISGGTIDNSTIGVTTATTGQFTQVGVGTSADVVSVIETNALTSQSWTGGTAYMIEEYLYATYRTVKYVGQVSDGTNVDAFEVLVTYKGASEPADNNAIFMTTYAYIASNSDTPLGTVSAAKSGSGGSGKIQLKFTPTSSGTFKSAVTATQVIKQ